MSALENFFKPDAPSNLEKLADTRFPGEKPDIGALDRPLFRDADLKELDDMFSELDDMFAKLEEIFGSAYEENYPPANKGDQGDSARKSAPEVVSKESNTPRDVGDDVEKSLEELIEDYYNDLKEKSEYPETINEDNGDWEKQPPEVVAERRGEFNEIKEKLIKEWEEKTGMEWPRYEEDVYSPSGKLIRHKGDRYDAHHIVPLSQGGKNEAGNITPLHASVHFDKQGVHSPESPYGKIEQKSQGVQA